MYASSPFEGRKLGAGLIMETLAGRPLNPPFFFFFITLEPRVE